MRIMITGGGTGGHTSPAVAIIEELHKRDPRLIVQWVGCKGRIEEHVSRRLGIPFRSVPVEGWPRTRRVRKVWTLAKLALSIVQSAVYIKRFRPQVIVGVGGFASLPLCYAAQRLGVPTIMHEQNKRLGMANRLLAPRAARLLLSYPDTLGDYPEKTSRVVGNPVRAGFAHPPSKEAACEKLDLDASIPVVLVSGGSQGAHTLNAAMLEAVRQFSQGEVQFVWMTGNSDVAAARTAAEGAPVRVDVSPFIDDMVTACAAADVIVGRAGASSTAEIAMLGKPSLLIPYPHATDNHQEQNARAFEKAGAAVVMLDHECSGETLTAQIRSLIADPARLCAMGRAASTLARPGAAEAIVEEILVLAFSGGAED